LLNAGLLQHGGSDGVIAKRLDLFVPMAAITTS